MREQVEALLTQWRKNTLVMSSCSAMMDRPEFAAIVALGSDAVPALLGHIAENPHISLLLSMITGARPVKPEHAGCMREVAADWIAWGKAQ